MSLDESMVMYLDDTFETSTFDEARRLAKHAAPPSMSIKPDWIDIKQCFYCVPILFIFFCTRKRHSLLRIPPLSSGLILEHFI